MTAMLPAVEVSQLSKWFPRRRGWVQTARHPWQRERTVALDAVNVSVDRGECFGLLGQNGAGKTTLFKILATLIAPDKGRARVLGHETLAEGGRVRRLLAPVIANERSLNWRLSAHENLRLFAALHGLSSHAGRARTAEVLETVGLASVGAQMVGQFSSGMMQRLLIARALLAQPAVLLLDEPTRSLDPISARRFRRFLRDEIVYRHECTVLLATHNAEEVRDVCDRVAILERGRILATGSTADLMAKYGEPTFLLWTTRPDHPALVGLTSKDGAPPRVVSTDGDGWACVELIVSGGLGQAAAVVSALVENGVPVARFEQVSLSLADLLHRVLGAHQGASHG